MVKKHVLCLAIAALLTISAVLAQANTQQAAQTGNTHQIGPIEGLQHAQVMTQNQEAAQELKQNLERWMERHQATIHNADEVDLEQIGEHTGIMRIRARETVRWLGISFTDEQTIVTDAEGNTLQHRKNWVHRIRAMFNKELE
jgi:hypothetical protein